MRILMMKKNDDDVLGGAERQRRSAPSSRCSRTMATLCPAQVRAPKLSNQIRFGIIKEQGFWYTKTRCLMLKRQPKFSMLKTDGDLVPGPGSPATPSQREFLIHNLMVRIHFIIVMIRWSGLTPCEFEFPFPGSLTSTFLCRRPSCGHTSRPGRDHRATARQGGHARRLTHAGNLRILVYLVIYDSG